MYQRTDRAGSPLWASAGEQREITKTAQTYFHLFFVALFTKSASELGIYSENQFYFIRIKLKGQTIKFYSLQLYVIQFLSSLGHQLLS